MDIIPGNNGEMTNGERHGHGHGHDDDDGDPQILGTTPPPREAFKKRNSMTRMESYLNSSGEIGSEGDGGGPRRARDRLDSDCGDDVNIFLTADELMDLADERHVTHDYEDDDDDEDDVEADTPFRMDDEGDGKRPAIAAADEGEGDDCDDHRHHHDDDDAGDPFFRRHPIEGSDEEDDGDVGAPMAATHREEVEKEAIRVRAELYPALRRRFFSSPPNHLPSPGEGEGITTTADDANGGGGDDDGNSSVVVEPCLVETCFGTLVLLALRCSPPAPVRGYDSSKRKNNNRHGRLSRMVDMEAVHLLLSEIVSRYHCRHHRDDGEKHHGKAGGSSMSIALEVEGVIRTLHERVPLIDIVASLPSNSSAAAGEEEDCGGGAEGAACYEITLHPDLMGSDGDGGDSVVVPMDRFAAWLLVGRCIREDEDNEEAVSCEDVPSEDASSPCGVEEESQRTDNGEGGKDDESPRGGIPPPPPSARRFWSYLVSSMFRGASSGGGNDGTNEVAEVTRVIHAILASECLRVLDDDEEEGKGEAVTSKVDVDVGVELSSALRRHLLDRIGLEEYDGFGERTGTAAEAQSSPLRRYALLNVVRHVVGAGDLLLRRGTTPGEILERTLVSDAFLLRRLLLPRRQPPSSSGPPPPPRDLSVDDANSSSVSVSPSCTGTTNAGSDYFERHVLHNWRSVVADAEMWFKWADRRGTEFTTRDGNNPDVRLLGLYGGWAERCYGVRLPSREERLDRATSDGDDGDGGGDGGRSTPENGPTARPAGGCSCSCSYSSRHVGMFLLMLGRSLGGVFRDGHQRRRWRVAAEELLYHRESLRFQTESVLSSSAMTPPSPHGRSTAAAADEGFDVTRIASARVVDHRRWRRQKREAAAAAVAARGTTTPAAVIVPFEVNGDIRTEDDENENDNDADAAWGNGDDPTTPAPTATVIDVVDYRGRRLRLPVPSPRGPPAARGSSTGYVGGGDVALPPLTPSAATSSASSGAAAATSVSAALDLSVLGETLHEIGCAILSSSAGDGTDGTRKDKCADGDDENGDEDRHEVAVRYLNGARQLLRLFLVDDDFKSGSDDRSSTGGGASTNGPSFGSDELDRKHHGEAVVLGGGSVASSSSFDVGESPPIGSMLDPDEYRRVCTALGSVEVHLGTVQYTQKRRFHEALAHFDRALKYYQRVGVGTHDFSSCSSPGTPLSSPRSTANFRDGRRSSPGSSSRTSSSLIGQMLASLRDGDDGTREYRRADLLRRIKLHVAQRQREYWEGRGRGRAAVVDDYDDGDDDNDDDEGEADADAWDELSSLYGWMGSTHREMGRHETALECFVESVVCANASATSAAAAASASAAVLTASSSPRSSGVGGGDGLGILLLAMHDDEEELELGEIFRNHGGAMARGFFNMAVTLDDMGMYDQSVRFYDEAWSYYWNLWLRNQGRRTPPPSVRHASRSRRVEDDYRLFADMMECVLCMGNVMMVRSDRFAALGYYLEGLVLFLAEWCNLSMSAVVASSRPRLRHLRTRGHDVFGNGTCEQREVKLIVDDDGRRLHCLTRFLVSDDFNLWNLNGHFHGAFGMSTGDRSTITSTEDDVASNAGNEVDEDEKGGNDAVHAVRDHNTEDDGGDSLDTSFMETTAEESAADNIEAEAYLHLCLRERLQRLFAAARDIYSKKGLDSKSRSSNRHPAHSSTFSREDFFRIMSDVAFYLNDNESAMEYCQRSFDDDGDEKSSTVSSWSLYRLGLLHIRLQDYTAAKSKLCSFLECHRSVDNDHHANSRQYADALYHLGYCHAQLGNRTESHRCYERSLHLLSSHHQNTHGAKTDERRQTDYDLSCANIWHEMACLSLSCDGSDSSTLTKTLSSDPHSSTTDEALRFFIRSVETYQLHCHLEKQRISLAFSLKHLAMMYRLILQCDDAEAGENERRASLMKNEAHDLLCEAMVIWQKARATEKLNRTTLNMDVNVHPEDVKGRDDAMVVPRCPSTTELEMADIFYQFGLLSLAAPSHEITDKNDVDQSSSGTNEEEDRKEAEQNFKRALYAYLHYYQYNLAASSSTNDNSRGRSSHVDNKTSIRNSVKLAKIYQHLSRTARGNIKSGNDEACGSRSLLYLQNAKNIMSNINSSASASTGFTTEQSSSTASELASRDMEDVDMDEPQRHRLEFEAELCHDLGTEYVFLQKHSNALDCLSRSLELRREIGKSLSSIENGHIVVGNGNDEMLRSNTEQRVGTCAEQSVAAEEGLRRDNVVNNAVKMARTCNNIGIIHAKMGRYDVAMSYLQEALLFTTTLPEEASGDLDSTAMVLLSPSGSGGLSNAIPTIEAKEERSNTLFSMGHVHAKNLNFEAALECFEASLNILRAIEAEKKDAHGFILSNLLHSLGRTHAKLHQWTEAKFCYQESVEIRRLCMRDKNKRAIDCSGPLDETPHSANDNNISEEEDDHWVMTDDEDDDIDGPLRLSHSLHHLGIAHEHLGDYKNAMICYEEAWFLRKLHLTRDHVIMAQSLLRMGNVKVHDGCHYEVALKLYQEALRVQRLNLGEDHLSVAETHYRMGMIRHVRGEWTQARECYKKALGVYRSNGENQCHSSYDEDMTGTTMTDIMNAWKEVKVYEKECMDSEDGGLVHDWSKLSVDPKGCSEKMEEMLNGLLELVDQYIVTPGCEMAQQNISKAVSSIQEYYSWTTCPPATSLPMAVEGRRTTPSDSRVHNGAQQMGLVED